MTDRKQKLILQLPRFMRKSMVYDAIFGAIASQIDARALDFEDLCRQMSVETATWALAIYEAELRIPIDPNKSISERRAVIKSKMRGFGKVDSALIKIVADSYTNGDVDVHFTDGTIVITFTSVVGLPPNIEDLQTAIEEIKPAHLAVLYVYLYNTHQVLSVYTHQDLSAYTHEQLRSTDLT